MADAKGTVVSIELRMNFLNNLPMMIDDMSQVKKEYDGDFTKLVYLLCAGKGKDRSNINLGLNKSTSWKKYHTHQLRIYVGDRNHARRCNQPNY